jgi:uncharacterized repeat protein (TIGR01451 family)
MKKNIYLIAIFALTCLSAIKSTAQYHIISTTLEYSHCDSLFFRIGIDTGSESASYGYSVLRLTTYLGDGTSRMDTLLHGTPRVYVGHHFTESGVYTVKSVLDSAGYPIDSITFADTVNLCSTLHLTSYVDHSGTCSDSGAAYMPNPYTIEVDSAGHPVDTLTSTSFFYTTSAGTPSGTIYSFKVITEPSGYVVSCPSTGILYDTVVSGSSSYPSSWYMAMGFTCDTTAFDFHIWGTFSGGLSGACSHVYAYEYGCATVPNDTITINYSPKYVYDSNSAGMTPLATGTGWVKFYIPSMAPDSLVDFICFFGVSGTDTFSPGDTTYTTWTIDPIAGDTHPYNNVHSSVDTIRSSYDPNEKTVYPQGNIDAGTTLQYTIGFENTGNDTAFNIHVQDTLSNNLDITTFQLVSASAYVITELSKDAAGQNIVKFDFPHINLLDRSHPGKNTGSVQYSIAAKKGLAKGTVITNEAGIYFDYNPVVMTGKTVNNIGTPAGVAKVINSSNVALYPNPATDVLTISMQNANFNNLTIFNSMGQAMLSQPMTATQSAVTVGINVHSFPAGVYFVNLQGANGVTVQKFVKE